MLNYFLKLINCNKRRTTQGGGVAAPVGGQILSEVLPYLEVEQGNREEIEENVETIVPDVTNKTLTEAITILNNEGFEVKINSETEELNKDETIVEKQIPSPGIKAYKGSNVYLN